jgi:hypothetical protein
MKRIFSSVNNGVRRNFLVTLAAVVALAATPGYAQVYPGHLLPEHAPERIEFAIDVAEDMAKFVEPRVPVGTEPLRGSFFVTEGRIYPAGTITASNSAMFDPNAPGSVGTWFCKGTFLVPGSQFDKAAAAVLSDQMYLLPDDLRSIATTGTEGNGKAVRAVIGGTGPFQGYVGEQHQEFLGFNKSGGVNLRVTIKLRRVAVIR